jgi:hypothetical protein
VPIVSECSLYARLNGIRQLEQYEEAYTKAMPTMPKPTTTTFFLRPSDGVLSPLTSAPSGARLIAMPGEDVAQDMLPLLVSLTERDTPVDDPCEQCENVDWQNELFASSNVY